jgi:hypothetical protein
VHCQRYQDWRRIFGISATILSLLTALFAVLGVTVPVIINSWPFGASDIHFSLLDWSESDVKLIVSNRGIRPAVVKMLKLEPKDDTPVDLELPKDANSILEPSKFEILTFIRVVGHKPVPIDPRENIRSPSKLYLIIFPFAGEPSQIACENWSEEK